MARRSHFRRRRSGGGGAQQPAAAEAPQELEVVADAEEHHAEHHHAEREEQRRAERPAALPMSQGDANSTADVGSTAVTVITVSAAEDRRTRRACRSVVANMDRAQAGIIHPAALSPEKVSGGSLCAPSPCCSSSSDRRLRQGDSSSRRGDPVAQSQPTRNWSGAARPHQ